VSNSSIVEYLPGSKGSQSCIDKSVSKQSNSHLRGETSSSQEKASRAQRTADSFIDSLERDRSERGSLTGGRCGGSTELKIDSNRRSQAESVTVFSGEESFPPKIASKKKREMYESVYAKKLDTKGSGVNKKLIKSTATSATRTMSKVTTNRMQSLLDSYNAQVAAARIGVDPKDGGGKLITSETQSRKQRKSLFGANDLLGSSSVKNPHDTTCIMPVTKKHTVNSNEILSTLKNGGRQHTRADRVTEMRNSLDTRTK